MLKPEPAIENVCKYFSRSVANLLGVLSSVYGIFPVSHPGKKLLYEIWYTWL